MKPTEVVKLTKDIIDFVSSVEVDGQVKLAALKSAVSVMEHVQQVEYTVQAMAMHISNSYSGNKDNR